VKNGSGAFNPPTAANVTAAIDDATTNADGSLTLNFTTSAAEAYPISTVSYFLVPTKMDTNKGDNLKAFLAYALGSGQDKANGLGYAPLPAKIQALAVAQAAKVNPEPATTSTTVTTAAPTTTTTAKKAVVTPIAPTSADPALAKSGRDFAFPVTLGSLLTLAGLVLLFEARRNRRARRTT
jgi:PBP superfamily domain